MGSHLSLCCDSGEASIPKSALSAQVVEAKLSALLLYYFNGSVGLITCERRLFGKTDKQESSLRSGSGGPVCKEHKRRRGRSAL